MNICIICLESIENNFAKKQYFNCECNLNFHNKCIENWIVKTPSCPMCRCMMNVDLLYTPRRFLCFLFIFFSFALTVLILVEGIRAELH